MSEQILKALMELFAIIARPKESISNEGDRRIVVESYLRRILNQELIDGYLSIFDQFYARHLSLVNSRGEKRIGPDSVKILRICDQINKELTQKQKLVVLNHLFEFVNSNNAVISNQECEFIKTVADSFHIEKEEHNLIRDFTIKNIGEAPESHNLLVVNNEEIPTRKNVIHIFSKQFRGELWLMQATSANIYFIRYLSI